MLKHKLMDEMTSRVSAVLAAGPARDVEKNLKASLSAWLAKLDMVSREEFDVQALVLARTRQRMEDLEARIARLEQGGSSASSVTPACNTD